MPGLKPTPYGFGTHLSYPLDHVKSKMQTLLKMDRLSVSLLPSKKNDLNSRHIYKNKARTKESNSNS